MVSMEKQLRIACFGEWHVHGKDFARKLADYPGCSVYPIGSDNYEKILEDPLIDAVMITAATADHGRLITAAAAAGKHVFVEKALAVSN